MQRNMELIRKLLFEIEETNDVKERNDPSVAYHLYLLADAGLIVGVKIDEDLQTGELSWRHLPGPRLTWAGQEFFDAARDDATWNQAKKRLADAGRSAGNVTACVMTALLTDVTKRQLGL